jgi:hypothetical protein
VDDVVGKETVKWRPVENTSNGTKQKNPNAQPLNLYSYPDLSALFFSMKRKKEASKQSTTIWFLEEIWLISFLQA